MKGLFWAIIFALGIPTFIFFIKTVFRLIRKPYDLSEFEKSILSGIDKMLQKIPGNIEKRRLIIAIIFTFVVGTLILIVSYYVGVCLIGGKNIIIQILFLGALVFLIVNFLSGEKVFGRGVEGGMESSITIACGSFTTSIGGAIYGYSRVANIFSNYPHEELIIISLIIIGFIIIFIGAKEGPVYGWNA